VAEVKITCTTQCATISAEDWKYITYVTANPDLVLDGRTFYNNKVSTTGVYTRAQRLFKCPYCDCLSDTPGVCKNCGGVKEIWYE